MSAGSSRRRTVSFALGVAAFLGGVAFLAATAHAVESARGEENALFAEVARRDAASFGVLGAGLMALALILMGVPVAVALRAGKGAGAEGVKLRCRGCSALSPEESRFCGACAQPL